MKYYLNILFLFLIGCSNNHQTILDTQNLAREDALFKKATSLRQGSELEWIYYDSIIALNPNYDKAWFEKAVWSIKSGDYINFIKYIDKAVDISNDKNLGYRASIKLRFLRDYEGAIHDLNTLLSIYPNQKGVSAWGDPALFLLGKAYWQMKEYKTAIDYFNKYIKEETEENGEDWVNVKTFLYKGICLLELNKNQEALESFEKGIEYNQQFSEAYYYAGKTMLRFQKNGNACDYFLKARKYAEDGLLLSDSYREVFGQLYLSDILNAYENNCIRD